MDPFVTHGDDGLHTLQRRPLGSPVARTAGTVLRAGKHHQRSAFLLVAHRRIVDAHLLAAREMDGPVAFLRRHQSVRDTDVAERPTHHHLVVSPPRAVRVEIHRLHATLDQPPARRSVLRNCARGRDMIGGDRIAQPREYARTLDVCNGGRLLREILEERRLRDVRGVRIPGKPSVAGFGNGEILPGVGSFVNLAVLLHEHLRLQRLADRVPDLVSGGPDVLEVYRLAAGVMPQRIVDKIDVQTTGYCIRNHQHGRRQIVGPHLRVDPRLEVAVTGQHGRHDQLMLGDGSGYGFRQRPAVAYARGAAVPHHVESQSFQIFSESGRVEVPGYNLRPRRHARLDPRLTLEPPGARLPRHKPRTNHHGRVGGVGAARDCRYDHRSIAHVEPVTVIFNLCFHHNIGCGRRCRGGRLSSLSGPAGGISIRQRALPRSPGGDQVRQHLGERGLEILEQHAILRPSRARKRRFHRGQIQFERAREFRVRRIIGPEQKLFPAVPLHAFHQILAPRAFEIGERLAVHREEADGGSILRRHVADRGAVGKAKVGNARSVEFNEPPHHSVLPEHLGHDQHQIRGRGPFRQFTGEFHPHDLGKLHEIGLAQHDRLRLDTAHAPAHHAESVDHRGVRVRAHQGVREGDRGAVILHHPHDACQILQIYLMHDPGARRHHGEIAERILRPAEQGVALAVPLHFTFNVQLESARRAEEIHLH